MRGIPPKGEALVPGVGVEALEGGCMRCAWCCCCCCAFMFIFGAFIGNDEAFEVAGMKFGTILEGEEVGTLPPYGELEYGV